MYSNMKYHQYENICSCLRGIQQSQNRKLYNDNCWQRTSLTPFQSGFVPGDSTTFQLLHTYLMFCEAVDSGKEARVVFCDISKAFDKVWHRGLTLKLRDIGCFDELLAWFPCY